MIFVLDNYDSFTYNLVQMLEALGACVEVARNDEITASALLARRPAGLVLSPGPGRPEEAGNMPEIVRDLEGLLPILGVCLGHQMIALRHGARIIDAPRIVHGKATLVEHDGRTIFTGLPNPLTAGRYHSLIVDPTAFPPELDISARTPDGEIMGLRHRTFSVEGVQFHPESILTPDGECLLRNFLTLCGL